MATITVYADSDGQILSGAANNYSLARSGNNFSVNTTSINCIVGQQGCSNPFTGALSDTCWESFLSFDTSAVVGATAATLWLYMKGSTGNANIGAGINEVRTHDWGTTLTSADWVAGASLGALPLVASWSRPSGWNNDFGYYEFTSNGTALLTSLNLTGFSRYIVNDSLHRLGINPGYSSDCEEARDWFSSSEVAGTTEDPKLVINTGTTPIGAWGAVQN